MGGGGEGLALCLDQRLDALGRPVEAAGERGDLVLALDLDAGGQVARAQRLHPGLQPLQPPREASGQRPGTDGDGKGEQGEGGEEADRRRVQPLALRTHQDEAAVRQRQREGAILVRAPAAGSLFGRGQGLAQAAEQRTLCSKHADTSIELSAQANEGGIDLGPGGIARRQRLGQQHPDAPAQLASRGLVVGQPPADGGKHAEEHDDAEQRQIDLEEEAPSHGSSSWRRVKT